MRAHWGTAMLLAALACQSGCGLFEDLRVRQGDGGSEARSDADADTDSATDADGGEAADSDTDSAPGTDTQGNAGVSDCAGGRFDPASGLCWQHPMQSGAFTWQAAEKQCSDLDLAGHGDWSLPTRQDFINLLGGCDATVLSGGGGRCNPCAASATCSDLFGSDAFAYWSDDHQSDQGWYVRFDDGDLYLAAAADEKYVRCVRPGP